MHLVLLGPPGSGKSTIAQPLIERHHLTLLATGQRLREEVAARSPIGLAAESYIERGELAPDDLIQELINEALHALRPEESVLMDGYPRTQQQALMLECTLAELKHPLTAVINLEVPDEEVVRRISGRRMCTLPGQPAFPIHIDDSDAIAHCQVHGGTLTQRDDDAPDLVRQRLQIYHQNTAPLISFYQDRGLLLPIDASGTQATVVGRVQAALTSFHS